MSKEGRRAVLQDYIKDGIRNGPDVPYGDANTAAGQFLGDATVAVFSGASPGEMELAYSLGQAAARQGGDPDEVAAQIFDREFRDDSPTDSGGLGEGGGSTNQHAAPTYPGGSGGSGGRDGSTSRDATPSHSGRSGGADRTTFRDDAPRYSGGTGGAGGSTFGGCLGVLFVLGILASASYWAWGKLESCNRSTGTQRPPAVVHREPAAPPQPPTTSRPGAAPFFVVSGTDGLFQSVDCHGRTPDGYTLILFTIEDEQHAQSALSMVRTELASLGATSTRLVT